MADAPGAPALLATRLPTLMQLPTPLEMLDTHTTALDLLAAHAPALDLLAAHAPALDLLAVRAPALVCHPLARPPTCPTTGLLVTLAVDGAQQLPVRSNVDHQHHQGQSHQGNGSCRASRRSSVRSGGRTLTARSRGSVVGQRCLRSRQS